MAKICCSFVLASSLLEHVGVAPENAKMVAESLVLADSRGVDTHGLSRLEVYIERVRAGSLKPNPMLEIVQKTPVMASIDAQNTFGFVAAHMATSHCIQVLVTFGIGITAVKNSGHLGMAATYALQAMERGYTALLFPNSSPSTPPWGSKEPIWGTNQLAVGFPGGLEGDFLLDMSPAVVARGKVIKAAKTGDSIPESWALDAQGHPTINAAEALRPFVGSMWKTLPTATLAINDCCSLWLLHLREMV